MDDSRTTLIITTRDRLEQLKITLIKLKGVIKFSQIIICDDGSQDGTSTFIKTFYPKIYLIRNIKNKGLIASRNILLGFVKTPYAISLDDDANFLTDTPLKHLEQYFDQNPLCAVLAFRLFWGLKEPEKTTTKSDKTSIRVRSYAGGAHAIRMSSWRQIPNYPEWYTFYGEEDFASYHLFQKKMEVHYFLPVLVHHRVKLVNRKQNKDYIVRTRRSLHAAWSNYFLFLPISLIPKRLVYSIVQQLKRKVFKGDFKALLGVILAFVQLSINIGRLIKHRKALSKKEYQKYFQLPTAKIYWNPSDE